MTVKHSLLSLLAESPATGYGLKQRYEERTGALWPVNIGQVYKTLGRLEDEGLVGREAGDDNALFTLTSAGRSTLIDWLVEPVSTAGVRDELVVKVLLAVATPGVDGMDIVQRHRRALIEQTQQITRTRQNDDDLTWTLLVDSMVLRLEAALRWLDRCEARLAQQGGARR